MFMATHRFAGGKVEVLAGAVRSKYLLQVVTEHHRATQRS
jgi:hypothetical protein